MTLEDHAQVFESYLNRVRLSDLGAIVSAIAKCWQEQANGNAGSQLSAQQVLSVQVLSAIRNISRHDLNNIETITLRNYQTLALTLKSLEDIGENTSFADLPQGEE